MSAQQGDICVLKLCLLICFQTCRQNQLSFGHSSCSVKQTFFVTSHETALGLSRVLPAMLLRRSQQAPACCNLMGTQPFQYTSLAQLSFRWSDARLLIAQRYMLLVLGGSRAEQYV